MAPRYQRKDTPVMPRITYYTYKCIAIGILMGALAAVSVGPTPIAVASKAKGAITSGPLPLPENRIVLSTVPTQSRLNAIATYDEALLNITELRGTTHDLAGQVSALLEAEALIPGGIETEDLMDLATSIDRAQVTLRQSERNLAAVAVPPVPPVPGSPISSAEANQALEDETASLQAVLVDTTMDQGLAAVDAVGIVNGAAWKATEGARQRPQVAAILYQTEQAVRLAKNFIGMSMAM